MLISILIPVRDDEENLRVCLQSLSYQDLTDCEVLVCDDGSRVEVTAADVAPPNLPVRIYRQLGKGPSVARNYLATKAQGRYLFFLDSDTVPCHNTVACVKSIIEEHSDIHAFFGSYDDTPEHPGLISTYRNLLHYYTHQQSAGSTVTTFWCGCGVVLRDVYLDCGGLSEFYQRPSIEDIEFGLRITQRGVKVWIFSELQVQHRKHWTVSKWLYTDLFCRGIPWVRLMRSSNHWRSQLNFTWAQRIAALAAVCFVLSLAGLPLTRIFALPAAAMLALFLWLNHPFFALIARKRGLLDAAAVVPCHIVYALICVSSVVAGILSPGQSFSQRKDCTGHHS